MESVGGVLTWTVSCQGAMSSPCWTCPFPGSKQGQVSSALHHSDLRPFLLVSSFMWFGRSSTLGDTCVAGLANQSISMMGASPGRLNQERVGAVEKQKRTKWDVRACNLVGKVKWADSEMMPGETPTPPRSPHVAVPRDSPQPGIFVVASKFLPSSTMARNGHCIEP